MCLCVYLCRSISVCVCVRLEILKRRKMNKDTYKRSTFPHGALLLIKTNYRHTTHHTHHTPHTHTHTHTHTLFFLQNSASTPSPYSNVLRPLVFCFGPVLLLSDPVTFSVELRFAYGN